MEKNLMTGQKNQNAVDNAITWDYIKNIWNNKKKKHLPHCDSMGREMKSGDIVLYPQFQRLMPGIIIGFNEFADGLRCEVVSQKEDIPNNYSHRYYTLCKECIKIPSLELLKKILEQNQ